MAKRPRIFDNDHIEHLTIGFCYCRDASKSEWGYRSTEDAGYAWPKARDQVFRRLIEKQNDDRRPWQQRFSPLMPWGWWQFEAPEKVPDDDMNTGSWRDTFGMVNPEAETLRRLLAEGKLQESEVPAVVLSFLESENLYKEKVLE